MKSEHRVCGSPWLRAGRSLQYPGHCAKGRPAWKRHKQVYMWFCNWEGGGCMPEPGDRSLSFCKALRPGPRVALVSVSTSMPLNRLILCLYLSSSHGGAAWQKLHPAHPTAKSKGSLDLSLCSSRWRYCACPCLDARIPVCLCACACVSMPVCLCLCALPPPARFSRSPALKSGAICGFPGSFYSNLLPSTTTVPRKQN